MLPGMFGFVSGTTGVTTPSYVGAGGRFASQSGQTVDYPAGIAANDLLMLVVQCDDADTVSKPSGWTHLFKQLGAGGSCEVNVYYKFHTTGTGVYVSDVGDHQCSGVVAFRNVNLANPIHKYSSGQITTSHLASSISGLTTTQPKTYVIYGVGHDSNSTSGVITWSGSSLTGPTELVDYSTSFGWHGGFSLYGGTKPTSGATGTATATNTTPFNQLEFCIALNAGP